MQDRKIRILAIDDEEIYLHAIVGLLTESYKIIIALSQGRCVSFGPIYQKKNLGNTLGTSLQYSTSGEMIH